MAMVSADTVLTALTVAAGLSLGVERTLELLKHFIEFGNGSLSPKERADTLKRAADLVDQVEAVLANPAGRATQSAMTTSVSSGTAPANAPPNAPVVQAAADSEASEKYPPPQISVISMEPLRPQDTGNALFFQFAGVGLGIIFASVFGLHLLSLLTGGLTLSTGAQNGSYLFSLADTLFTGLVIGGGSQPIHVLIRFLTERKVTTEKGEAVEDAEQEVEKTRALAKVISTEGLVVEKKESNALAWIDIPYRGGVSPEQLNNVHRRSGKPNLIVYHHTAMSSSSSFQDVVNEFHVTKKWLTGYHCVIMPDGTIKPFCRWDRSGNHAKGLNDRSLGLSFHGNFHTTPGPYSNADGRFGNQKPTEAQLHAGARVVVLWINLYEDLRLDFSECILSHKQAMRPGYTDCPGSNFPTVRFQDLVREYHDAWSQSTMARNGIEAFKQLPYVYA